MTRRLKEQLPGIDCFTRRSYDEIFTDIVFEAPTHELFEFVERKSMAVRLSSHELESQLFEGYIESCINSRGMNELIRYSNKILYEHINKNIVKVEPLYPYAEPVLRHDKIPVDIWMWAGATVVFLYYWLQFI
jgi:hypothetical protein